LHAKPHEVPSQVAVALAGTAHGVHIAPQVAGSVLAAQTPPQSWKPALHAKLQLVPLQVAVALAGALHGVHEVVPQLAVLELLTHTPPHE
jgi:hypothetical protein